MPQAQKYAVYFEAALKEAEKAARKNEVPIGVVLVKDGVIIARAHNLTEKKGHFFAHAELLCLQKASKKLKSKYLLGCDLYITLEPCRMCWTAAQLARIERIHYLARSPQFGRKGKAYKQTKVAKIKSNLTQNAVTLLQEFFEKKR